MRAFIYFSIIGMVFGCTKKWPVVSSTHFFTIEDRCTFHAGQGLDADIGTMQCGPSVFDYEYGRYSAPGPLTDSEKFLLAFKGHYYVNFFEKAYIDPKLNRMYIDSVQVLKLEDIEGNRLPLAVECFQCNKVVTLQFRKKRYFYPWRSAPDTENDKYLKFYIDTIDGYHRKVYISGNSEIASGLYMESLKEGKQGKKLSVQTHTKAEDDKLLTLFRSIRIKKNQ